jgi:hypothetical protein
MVTWERTQLLKDRISELLDSDGNYEGRPLIYRDQPIDGGVSLGGFPREAIVVDSKKYPAINRLYEIAKRKATVNGKVLRSGVLRAVYDTVNKALPTQSEFAVNQLLANAGIGDDEKITLDAFINEGVGVCRHSGLTAGVLLERFIKDGHIRGNVSIDRNTTGLGGHEWARYTSFNGNVAILDVTQRFFGTLEESAAQFTWPYARPEDSVRSMER